MDKSEKLVKIEQRLKKVFHLRNEDSNSNSNRYRHEDETSESEDSVLSVRHSNSFNNNSSNNNVINNTINNTINNNSFDIQSINTSSHSIGNGNSGNTISNTTTTTTNNNTTNNNTILRIIESVFRGDISLSQPPLFNQDTITQQDTIQICESVRRCCENVPNITFEWFEMHVMYELLVVLGDAAQIREAILLGYRECNTSSQGRRTLQLLTSIDTNNTAQQLLQHQLLS